MSVANTLHRANRNAKTLANSKKAGCFCCCAIFDSNKIKDFTDLGETALCPECGADAVLPETDLELIDEAYLHSVKAYWAE